MSNMNIEIKNNKINWICLEDKCIKNCCGSYKGDNIKKSFFNVRGNMIPLTKKDYNAFVKNGFKKYLTESNDGGWYIKTKKDGTCQFLKENKCSIYCKCTASSCKSYPFIFTKYAGLIADLDCPGWGKGWTNLNKIKQMINELINVYEYQIQKTKNKLNL